MGAASQSRLVVFMRADPAANRPTGSRNRLIATTDETRWMRVGPLALLCTPPMRIEKLGEEQHSHCHSAALLGVSEEFRGCSRQTRRSSRITGMRRAVRSWYSTKVEYWSACNQE